MSERWERLAGGDIDGVDRLSCGRGIERRPRRERRTRIVDDRPRICFVRNHPLRRRRRRTRAEQQRPTPGRSASTTRTDPSFCAASNKLDGIRLNLGEFGPLVSVRG